MIRTGVRVLLVLLLVGLIVLQAILVHREGFSKIDCHKENGKAILYQVELVPRTKIEQFLIQDDKVYIFYDDAGLLNVYALDGRFLYGVQVDTLANGRGDIAYTNGKLLIKSRGNTIYVFEETCLVEHCTKTHSGFVSKTDEYMRYVELEKHFELEKCQQSANNSFRIGDDGYMLYMSDSDGSYLPVEFLPKRNILVEMLPILILACLCLLSRLSVFCN